MPFAFRIFLQPGFGKDPLTGACKYHDVMEQVVSSHHWQLRQLAELSHFTEGLPILLQYFHRKHFPPTPACIFPQHPPWHWFGPKDQLPAVTIFQQGPHYNFQCGVVCPCWTLGEEWLLCLLCVCGKCDSTHHQRWKYISELFWCYCLLSKGQGKTSGILLCVCVCHSSCKSQR